MKPNLLFFLLLMCSGISGNAYAFSSVYCGTDAEGRYQCGAVTSLTTEQDATKAALSQCLNFRLQSCTTVGPTDAFTNACRSVAAPDDLKSWFSATAITDRDAEQEAASNCQNQHGTCNTLVTACDTPVGSTSAPTAASPAPVSPPSDIDWDGIVHAIALIEAKITIAAIAINAVLFLGLFKIISAHRRRLYILGVLTVICIVLAFGLHLVEPVIAGINGYIFLAFYVLERTATIGMYAAGIPFAALLVSKYAPLLLRHLPDRGLPDSLPLASKQIEVLIARSQRMNWLNRVVFMIDARLGVSAEQLDLMKKYRLGKTIVFDSARRERQNELARTHLEIGRERKSQTICLWREEWRGIFRRLWYLIRALVSFLLGFLFIRITLAKLIRGAHVESKSLDTILAAKNAIERAAGDLKAYLEVAETFDGREDLFEPS